MLVSIGVFLFAASQLNGLALALAPVAAVYVVAYSYAKYFTWTTHFVLGWADAIAAAGGWIAVTALSSRRWSCCPSPWPCGSAD